MKEIDARGLSCPAPVLQTKAAIETEKPSEIKVIVDNEAARQNVSRFLSSQLFDVSSESSGDIYYITGKRSTDNDTAPVTKKKEITPNPSNKTMVMVTTNSMGHGDENLGEKLMINFITTLQEMVPELWRIVLVNGGVKLSVDGSKVVGILKELESKGIDVLVCGTCLTHFNLLDQKMVGETTNMLDIITSMQLADKVITL